MGYFGLSFNGLGLKNKLIIFFFFYLEIVEDNTVWSQHSWMDIPV